MDVLIEITARIIRQVVSVQIFHNVNNLQFS